MNINGTLPKLCQGDDYDVIRDIPGIPDGALLTDAWLTVRKRIDSPVVIQKHATTIQVSGVGQITDTGGSGTGEILFQLTSTDTTLLLAGRQYRYDIQILTDTNKRFTVELGRFTPLPQVTTA